MGVSVSIALYPPSQIIRAKPSMPIPSKYTSASSAFALKYFRASGTRSYSHTGVPYAPGRLPSSASGNLPPIQWTQNVV